ncbi:DUF3592 domain-containing protein [Niveispirillum fermenti]|uniref:DUF3592 domain-containing protein n=1 Tax=Niveispirillum fermenti TaxID=1233113 RepID=UPI003A88C226
MRQRRVMVLGLLIASIAILVGVFLLHRFHEQAGWQQVDGRVLESSLKIIRSYQSSGGSLSSPVWTFTIRYRYQVDGRTYVGDRYSDDSQTADAKGGKPPPADLLERVARHPPGAPVTVHVAPGRPDRAVLRPMPLIWQPLAFGLGLLALCIAWGLRGRFRG